MSSTEDAEQKVGAHLRGWRYLQMDTERKSLSCSISNEYIYFSPSRSAVQLVVETADSATAERLLRLPSILYLFLRYRHTLPINMQSAFGCGSVFGNISFSTL